MDISKMIPIDDKDKKHLIKLKYNIDYDDKEHITVKVNWNHIIIFLSEKHKKWMM